MNPPEHRKTGIAWIALCLALALHVADEAATGFLSVYNPTVIALRERVSWLPMPVFRFDVWLGGLIVAVLALLALSPFAFRGVKWMRPVAYTLAILMAVNAVGHTLGTVFGRTIALIQFPRPMPGFYSSPLLFAASLYLLMRLREAGKHGLSQHT
jgi:hypothetical protein